MSGLSRGPGGGPKRRIRTRLQSVDSTTCLVLRNRSVKPIPANWRELLSSTIETVCAGPPRHFYSPGAYTPGRMIARPVVTIAQRSLPTGLIEFTLDRQPSVARLQKRVIDWSLALCDTRTWPVPKTTFHTGNGGEMFVMTGLLLNDSLMGPHRHSFNAFRLVDVPGITWQHLEQYTVRRGKARYLGIKTVCKQSCVCRKNLPSMWQFGWEMHY